MASEYIRLHLQGEGQDPAKKQAVPRQLSGKEAWKNWWYYHWKMVIVGAALAGAATSMLLHSLGITEPMPDYQIAYVGEGSLSDETTERITELFQENGTDANGDGEVTVKINQYVLYGNEQDYDSRRLTDASLTALEGDLATQTSYFFLLQDPEMFTVSYQALADADGSLPEEDDDSWEDKVWLLSDVVQGVPEEDGGLYLGRRGFYGEQTVKYQEACDRMWDTFAASMQASLGTSAAETESKE